MNVTTTAQRLGSSGYLIQNYGPGTLYVGESNVSSSNGVRVLTGEAVSVGETNNDVYVVSVSTSEVYALGEVLSFYSPPAAPTAPPDLSGYVTKAQYDADTVLMGDGDNNPQPIVIAPGQVIGRGNSGKIKGLTPEETAAVVGPASFTQPQAINPQTGTSYTPVAGDVGKLITLNNAAAIALSLPQDSAATLAIGIYLDFWQLGLGQVTVSAGSGATLRISGLTGKSRAQYSRFGAQKVLANTWVLFGDLAAS